jgi:hypothetical protein
MSETNTLIETIFFRLTRGPTQIMSAIPPAIEDSADPTVCDEDTESQADESRSRLENFKYFTSLVLGTLCIICIFAFLFLVPFILDPAISTLRHDFVDVPITCKVNAVTVRHGKKNCKWSSCREGCTADMFICFQVR